MSIASIYYCIERHTLSLRMASTLCVVLQCSLRITFDVSIALIHVPLMLIASILLMLSMPKFKWVVCCLGLICRKLVPIELINFQANSYYKLATFNKDGDLEIQFNSFEVYHKLNCNGKVDTYLYKFWMPLRKKDRVEFLLKNDLPDLKSIRKLPVEDRWQILDNI